MRLPQDSNDEKPHDFLATYGLARALIASLMETTNRSISCSKFGALPAPVMNTVTWMKDVSDSYPYKNLIALSRSTPPLSDFCKYGRSGQVIEFLRYPGLIWALCSFESCRELKFTYCWLTRIPQIQYIYHREYCTFARSGVHSATVQKRQSHDLYDARTTDHSRWYG